MGVYYCFITYGEIFPVVSFIAPDRISKTKPIVKTKKKQYQQKNPNKLIWYKVTAKGNNNTTSRSNIKDNKQTIKKWIWNVPLVWPGITLNPHFN